MAETKMPEKNYYAALCLTADTLAFIHTLLHTEPSCSSECFGEDEKISYTVRFSDGVEMDLEICGVQYQEGTSNLPWTQAVLFLSGSELAFTEPEGDFCGEWTLWRQVENGETRYYHTLIKPTSTITIPEN